MRAPSYLEARRGGRLIWSGWDVDGPEPLIAAARAAAADADALILCHATDIRTVPPERWPALFADRRRGRIGLEFRVGDTIGRVAPIETIATNRALGRSFARFLAGAGMDEAAFRAAGGLVRRIECRQLLVDGRGMTALFRGNSIVPPMAFGRAEIDTLIAGIARWFAANQDADGGLPYKYWPSRGVRSPADNSVRRFATAVALGRLAAATADPAHERMARRHLSWLLRRFYRDEDGYGLIAHAGSVKLGAVALAALAVLESPVPGREALLAALVRSIGRLWQSDGSFRTFWAPAERNDNQNFYPGEALYALACLQAREAAPQLGAAILRSLARYRARFFSPERNPAFVPWHTQACAAMYAQAPAADLANYVFAMNDWLLGLQQHGPPLAADLWGRFHDPARAQFGPPHASATGVYLEGLADALALAIRLGDAPRAATYDRAIQRGLRSLAQLQFTDDAGAFYIANRAAIVGAIRTETYDNEIRIDNMQHALAAMLKYRALLEAR